MGPIPLWSCWGRHHGQFYANEVYRLNRLVERHRLPELAEWFRGCGMEALVLGCTHFPYFKASLAERTSLPLLDPAEDMVRRLRQSGT